MLEILQLRSLLNETDAESIVRSNLDHLSESAMLGAILSDGADARAQWTRPQVADDDGNESQPTVAERRRL